jgi:hypothetical protein
MISTTDQSKEISITNKNITFKSNLVKINENLFKYPLILSDGSNLTIPMRKDGFINVTMIAKATKRRLDNWVVRPESIELIKYISQLPDHQGIKIIDTIRGKYGGTYYHPDLAIMFAQYCSPSLSVQVSRVIRELLLFGKVEMGNQKTSLELENKFQEEIDNIKLEYQTYLTQKDEEIEHEKTEKYRYMKLHNSRLQKHRFFKFKKTGLCFYAIIEGLEYADGVIYIYRFKDLLL